MGEEEKIGAFAGLDGAEILGEAEGDGVVKSDSAENERQRRSGVGPGLQFEAAVESRRITETISCGSIAAEDEPNMILKHELEGGVGSGDDCVEHGFKAGGRRGFAVFVEQGVARFLSIGGAEPGDYRRRKRKVQARITQNGRVEHSAFAGDGLQRWLDMDVGRGCTGDDGASSGWRSGVGEIAGPDPQAVGDDVGASVDGRVPAFDAGGVNDQFQFMSGGGDAELTQGFGVQIGPVEKAETGFDEGFGADGCDAIYICGSVSDGFFCGILGGV